MQLQRTALLLLSVATLLAAAPAQKATLPDDRAKGAAAVSEDDLRSWLGTLAGPDFEGRGTGQEGFRKAAEFVRDHFKACGLEPLGDEGTYFQRVPWSGAKVDEAGTWIAFSVDGKELMRVPAARLAGSVSKSASAKGNVMLLVLDAPKAPAEGRRAMPRFEGLEGVDAKDKVLVVHLRMPEGSPTGAVTTARFAATNALQGKGALAIVFADKAAVGGGLTGRAGMGRGGNPAAAGARLAPLNVAFGGDDTKALLAAAGHGQGALPEAGKPVDTKVAAELSVTISEVQLPAFNVTGVLRGADPELRDEYVVIGSHLDHLGRRGDTVYPGADDDGSGTTGVMAVVKAFTSNPVKPRRSIVFTCFCGEENGLVGSKFFVDNPPVPLDAIVAELQMDMIGRDEEHKDEPAEKNTNVVHLVGTRKMSNDLHELVLARNELAGLEVEYDEEGVFSRSDHANFAAKGIPIAFFFTGFHKDYHQPTDTPEKIHYAKLGRIAMWAYDIAFELAVQDARPLVDPELWEKARKELRGAPEKPAAPLRTK